MSVALQFKLSQTGQAAVSPKLFSMVSTFGSPFEMPETPTT